MDLLSTIPLDVVFQYGNLSKVVRFAKIGKIYKLIRVTKMVRLLQSAKLRSKFQTQVMRLLKIGAGLERMLIMLVTFVILQHVAACVW